LRGAVRTVKCWKTHEQARGFTALSMPDEKKDNDPMEGAPITAPKVDEASLLQDVRSPRFLAACNTLHIDPIELIPKPFEVFSERGLSQEKQQIRFAMYERGRLAKWTSLNECRRGLPKGGASKRSQSADPTMPTAKSKLGSSRLSAEGSAVSLGKSWIANELAKTSEIASRGQVPQPAPSRLRYGVRLPST